MGCKNNKWQYLDCMGFSHRTFNSDHFFNKKNQFMIAPVAFKERLTVYIAIYVEKKKVSYYKIYKQNSLQYNYGDLQTNPIKLIIMMLAPYFIYFSKIEYLNIPKYKDNNYAFINILCEFYKNPNIDLLNYVENYINFKEKIINLDIFAIKNFLQFYKINQNITIINYDDIKNITKSKDIIIVNNWNGKIKKNMLIGSKLYKLKSYITNNYVVLYDKKNITYYPNKYTQSSPKILLYAYYNKIKYSLETYNYRFKVFSTDKYKNSIYEYKKKYKKYPFDNNTKNILYLIYRYICLEHSTYNYMSKKKIFVDNGINDTNNNILDLIKNANNDFYQLLIKTNTYTSWQDYKNNNNIYTF